MNFNIKTNIIKRTRCFNIFRNEAWVTAENEIPAEKFYHQMSKSKYILAPEGTGIDCHRIYEAIYFNAIPVLEKTKMNKFYKKLPVIIVDNFNLITKEILEANYNKDFEKFKKWKLDNPDWLTANYWINSKR